MPEIMYVTWNLADTQKDIAGMSAEKRGIYLSLQIAYYQRGGCLPASADELCRLAGVLMPRERKAMQEVLSEKFIKQSDGTWKHSALDFELSRIREKKQQASDAANARWRDAPNEEMDMHPHVQTIMPTSKPVNIEQEINTEEETNTSTIYTTNNSTYKSTSINNVEVLNNVCTDVAAATNPNAADISLLKNRAISPSSTLPISVQPTPIPPKLRQPPLSQSAKQSAPWGDRNDLHAFARWKADQSTGWAPTEEEEQARKIRAMIEAGSAFVSESTEDLLKSVAKTP